MGWVISVVGAGMVLATLRDIFHTLWRPKGQGRLSQLVMTATWRLSQRRAGRGRVAALAGPLALVVVIGAWMVTIVVGWAFIYWPHIPNGVAYATNLEPARRGGLLDALYLSTVTLATLGFGDIVPTAGWLRVAVAFQGLLGFALLTAAVSWMLQIYPALTRRRVLAVRLTLLRRADTAGRIPQADPATTARLLERLAAEVAAVRVDLTQSAETYYFYDGDEASSLAATVGYATHLARYGEASQRQAGVRLAASVLACALEDLASTLDQQFLHVGGTVTEVLDAYAADHGHTPAPTTSS